jgi:hypothetical protein
MLARQALEQLHQPSFMLDIFEIESSCQRLASDPPNLCLLSSQDYRHELLNGACTE